MEESRGSNPLTAAVGAPAAEVDEEDEDEEELEMPEVLRVRVRG